MLSSAGFLRGHGVKTLLDKLCDLLPGNEVRRCLESGIGQRKRFAPKDSLILRKQYSEGLRLPIEYGNRRLKLLGTCVNEIPMQNTADIGRLNLHTRYEKRDERMQPRWRGASDRLDQRAGSFASTLAL